MKAKTIISIACVGFSAMIFAQSIPLSRSPLFVRPAVDPNIILSFDDSGSMNEGGTPNEVSSGVFLPNSNTANLCFWRDLPHFYAAESNNQFFDPLVVYAPPIYANGQTFPNAVFTGAYYDGFLAHKTGVELTTSPKRDLATDYAVSIYGTTPPGPGAACTPTPIAGRTQVPITSNLVTFGAVSQGACSTPQPYNRCSDGALRSVTNEGGVRASLFLAPNSNRAFYYTYNNVNPIDPMTGKPAKPTTAQLYGTAPDYNKANYLGPFLVTAAQETNFANWWTYYRTRQLMGRTAATRAFAQLPRNVRIGWQGITGSAIGTGFFIKKIEDTGQRNSFYSYLYNVPANSGTPTRAATDRVGNYFTRNTASYVESNPYYDVDLGIAIGNANSPATLISCRQNYHLIFTDGGWKDNRGSYNDRNTDQTKITNLPPTWSQNPLPSPADPNLLTDGPEYDLTDPNSRLYWNGPNQNEIGGYADRAFYYWATDLSTNLKNNVTPFIEDRTIGITDTTPRVLPQNPLDDGEVYWNPKNDPATWQHVVQYVVAFGLQSTLNFPGDLNNLRKGPLEWTDWSAVENSDPAVKVDDTWHAALNSRGELLAASNPQEVVQQLNSVFQAISARTSSVSAVSVAASLLSTNTFAYRTFFNASAWSGSVQGSRFDNTGAITVVWDAGCLLTGGVCTTINSLPSYTAPNPMTGRQIYTATSTGTAGASAAGVNFQWGQLSTAQQTLLNYNWDTALPDPAPIAPETKGGGEKRLEFLRGVRTEEGLLMRSRESVLGAVVNSNAVFVGGAADAYWASDDIANDPLKPLFPALPLLTSGPETKANFIAHVTAIANRPPTLYVGANDGMLHAFNANTGDERWAYVPNTGFKFLSRLSAKFLLNTQSSVDNTPSVREVYTNSAWRTMLVGSMRLGGQGIFALDVTDPNPTGAASKVLWEFNDESTLGTATGTDLGYTYGRPFITRVAAGRKWVVLVPGGYNSSDADVGRDTKIGSDRAVLFVLDAANGSVLRKFDLGAGTRGLSSIIAGDYTFAPGAVSGRNQYRGRGAPAPLTLDEVSDVAFAGDDNGNLWRFNLEGSTAASWSVVKFYQGPLPVSPATTSIEKITAQPRIVPASDVANAQKNLAVVVFGTGRYVATPDRGDNSQQSLYGIYDPGPNYSGYPITQANLQEQTRTESVVGTKVLIATGDLPVPTTKLGWFFKLGANGERSIAAASFLSSTRKLIVPTFIPTVNPLLANDPCVDDSSSVLYFLDPLNGGASATDDLAAFDVNGDGVINEADNALISGIRVPGFVAGATPITQAGGGQGAILLPAPPGGVGGGSAISTLAIPDYVWRRQSTRELPAFDPNERN